VLREATSYPGLRLVAAVAVTVVLDAERRAAGATERVAKRQPANADDDVHTAAGARTPTERAAMAAGAAVKPRHDIMQWLER